MLVIRWEIWVSKVIASELRLAAQVWQVQKGVETGEGVGQCEGAVIG
jgi:hypothetical protein